jgi:tRNA(Ile)-lysidine synthase TilS/MesJ
MSKEVFEAAFRLMLSKCPQLESKEKKVAVAVSGGPDSLTLLAAAVHFYGKHRVLAISVNHQLPGVDESRERVEGLVKRLGVEFVGKRIEWPQAKPPATSKIQVQAREARYRLMGRSARGGELTCCFWDTTRTMTLQRRCIAWASPVAWMGWRG